MSARARLRTIIDTRARGASLGALLALGALLPALPAAAPLAAQSSSSARGEAAALQRDRRVSRRLVYSAIGAGLGFALSSAYSTGRANPSSCSSAGCVRFASVTIGIGIGYLIGRESDQLHRLRFRTAPPLDVISSGFVLPSAPTALAVRESTVAVAGASGVSLITTGGGVFRQLARRATSVRGITSVDLVPGTGALVIGSPAGLFVYPAAANAGTVLRDTPVTAVAAAPGRVFFATGTRIEVAPEGADSARAWPGFDVGTSVVALEWDAASGLLWAGADSAVLALRPTGDSLVTVHALSVGGTARRLSTDGSRLAVALGEGGVRLYDLSASAAPVERARWSGVPYAYDVALTGQRLLVAAGREGIYLLDISGRSLVPQGLARDLGFVSALRTLGADTFMLDRSAPALRRVPTTLGEQR